MDVGISCTLINHTDMCIIFYLMFGNRKNDNCSEVEIQNNEKSLIKSSYFFGDFIATTWNGNSKGNI